MPFEAGNFQEARRLLRAAVDVNQLFRLAKAKRNKEEMYRCSAEKIKLACEATLVSPADIRWRVHITYKRTVSIDTTRTSGPQIHIPARLLKDHIQNNGFNPLQKALLWKKFDGSKTHAIKPKAKGGKKRRKKGPAKV